MGCNLQSEGLCRVWQWLYFKQTPENYEESGEFNRVDFICSGVFSAQHPGHCLTSPCVDGIRPLFFTQLSLMSLTRHERSV